MRAMKMRPGARLMAISQVSDEIGIPIDTLDKLIKMRVLPVVELPHVRRRFIDRNDLEKAIQSWKRGGDHS